MIGNFPAILIFNRLFLKLNRLISQTQTGLFLKLNWSFLKLQLAYFWNSNGHFSNSNGHFTNSTGLFLKLKRSFHKLNRHISQTQTGLFLKLNQVITQTQPVILHPTVFHYQVGLYFINSSNMSGNFPAVLNFNRLFLKLNQFICK